MKKGFTLIELLVVVLIIGILAAVALPQYRLAVDKTRLMTALPLMKAIDTAQNEYKMTNGKYALSFDELSVGLPGGASLGDDGRMHFNNLRCHIVISSVSGETNSMQCQPETANLAAIEKYFNLDYYLCWPLSVYGRKLCQAVSGQKEPGAACSGPDACAYDMKF